MQVIRGDDILVCVEVGIVIWREAKRASGLELSPVLFHGLTICNPVKQEAEMNLSCIETGLTENAVKFNDLVKKMETSRLMVLASLMGINWSHENRQQLSGISTQDNVETAKWAGRLGEYLVQLFVQFVNVCHA